MNSTSNGVLNRKLDIAENDTPGAWQIRVRELASGLVASWHVKMK